MAGAHRQQQRRGLRVQHDRHQHGRGCGMATGGQRRAATAKRVPTPAVLQPMIGLAAQPAAQAHLPVVRQFRQHRVRERGHRRA